MRPSRTLIQAIVLLVTSVYMAAYALQGLPTDDLLQPLGAATSIVGLFVLALDKFLWCLPRIGRRITKRPNLIGTWRGSLASHWVDPKTNKRIAPDPEVYLVIRQTLWGVSANLITRESKSCSTTATIEDDGCGQYQLTALYRNTPRAAVRHRSEVHHGAFKLDISGEPVDRLEGFYWTDRNTMGEFEFDTRYPETVESYAAAQGLAKAGRSSAT
jgi:SMODS-associating 2TM, beta-strand rich effector domain